MFERNALNFSLGEKNSIDDLSKVIFLELSNSRGRIISPLPPLYPIVNTALLQITSAVLLTIVAYVYIFFYTIKYNLFDISCRTFQRPVQALHCAASRRGRRAADDSGSRPAAPLDHAAI